jgi:3-oxoacyl-[acyl-carrier protein] reductase
MQLKDRVAIVTGAGQGIGASVAAAYAREGAKVAVVDMNGEAADKVAAAIVGAGGTAIGVACDVSNREQVEAMAAKVNAAWGRIDILVNNAGITRTAMLHKMTPEQWNQVVGVHLTGAFNCLQAVVGGMIERKYGRIIYVTSAAGVLGTIGQINYSAAKAGILGMTKSTAKELARYNITANAIAPGAATPMTEVIRTDEKFKDKYLDRIPAGSLGGTGGDRAGVPVLRLGRLGLRNGPNSRRRRRHDDSLNTERRKRYGRQGKFQLGRPTAARSATHRRRAHGARHGGLLRPGQAGAARAGSLPQREDRSGHLPRDGRDGPARHHDSRGIRRRRHELRLLRVGRARSRARRFGLPLDDERAKSRWSWCRSTSSATKRPSASTCPSWPPAN